MRLKDLLHPIEYHRKKKAEIRKRADNLDVLVFDSDLKLKVRRIGRSSLMYLGDLVYEVEGRGYDFLATIKSDDLDKLKFKAAKKGADTILTPQSFEAECMFCGDDMGTWYWTQAYHSK